MDCTEIRLKELAARISIVRASPGHPEHQLSQEPMIHELDDIILKLEEIYRIQLAQMKDDKQ